MGCGRTAPGWTRGGFGGRLTADAAGPPTKAASISYFGLQSPNAICLLFVSNECPIGIGKKMDTHYPRFGEQYRLPFEYEPANDGGKGL